MSKHRDSFHCKNHTQKRRHAQEEVSPKPRLTEQSSEERVKRKIERERVRGVGVEGVACREGGGLGHATCVKGVGGWLGACWGGGCWVMIFWTMAGLIVCPPELGPLPPPPCTDNPRPHTAHSTLTLTTTLHLPSSYYIAFH